MLGVFISVFLLSLPPQLSSLSEEEGSFTFSYNGGKLMTQPVSLDLLWFGDGWHEPGHEALRNAVASLTAPREEWVGSEVPTLRNWWEIMRQYRDSSNNSVTDSVNLGAECFYTAPGLNVTLKQVIEISRAAFNQSSNGGKNLSCTQVFEFNENAIYHVLFSNSVKFAKTEEEKELINSCSGDFEEFEVSNGKTVKVVWAREPQGDNDECSWMFDGESYLGPPNGDEKIDTLIGFMLGKIAEQVTNRDGRGWSTGVDGGELSVSSLCASVLEREDCTPPLFTDGDRNFSFNSVGANGYRYMVNQVWNQHIRNCAMQLSEQCGIGTVALTEPQGYLRMGITVNHTAGLQPYPPNQNCHWKIQYPSAKFVTFTLSYLSITENSYLSICQSDSNPGDCFNLGENSDKPMKIKGSRAFVKFISGNQVSSQSRGWELIYSAGLCDGKEDLYNHNGVIGYSPPTGFSYIGGLTCQWVLHGEPNTPVSLIFTHINTSKDLDFLAIYNSTGDQMFNFTGLFLDSDLPVINLTGTIMIAFATQTESGNGWSGNYFISSPVNRKKSHILIPIIVSVGVFTGLVLVFITLALVKHRRNLRNREQNNEKPKLLKLEVNRDMNRFEQGPSAIIYRAVLADGNVVAVKSPQAAKPKTNLEEEILLRSSHHPNIVSLMGYVRDTMGRRLLVFEFMGRGSLSRNLHESGEILSWETRLAIALQIALALQFLHMNSKPPIYHGNLGSENVLLEDSWNAKLGGFGSADYCKKDSFCSGKRSEMAKDVLRFGLLLIELLRGEALVRENSTCFSEYVLEVDEQCVDPRLGVPEEEDKKMGLVKLGEIAKWCISGGRGEGNNSPSIGDVVLSLKQVNQLFMSVER